MMELIQALALAVHGAVTARQDAERQEAALMRAEEHLALMRKRARFKKTPEQSE